MIAFAIILPGSTLKITSIPMLSDLKVAPANNCDGGHVWTAEAAPITKLEAKCRRAGLRCCAEPQNTQLYVISIYTYDLYFFTSKIRIKAS